MPDEVRERLRTRVLGDQRGKPRSRGLLAAAAAVVLVAGGLALSTSVDRTPSTNPGATTTPDDPQKDDLDRCWAALLSTGTTEGYPDRSQWIPVISAHGLGETRVTAAWAGDRPLFCQTSTTQVAVSDPNAVPAYVAGTGTGVLLRTEYGALGGVLDPTWPGLHLTARFADGAVLPVVAEHAQGLFVMAVDENLRDPRITIDVFEPQADAGTGVPLDPEPDHVTVIDRPGRPNPSSQESLTRCLQVVGEPDPASWEVGSDWLHRRDGRTLDGEMLLLRKGDQVGVCQTEPWPGGPTFVNLGIVPVPAPSDPPVRLSDAEPFLPTVMGVVSATAAYVDVTFGSFSLRTAVVNSTFGLEDAGPVTKVEVFDRNHALLYSGPFAEAG